MVKIKNLTQNFYNRVKLASRKLNVDLTKLIEENIRDCDSILDLGCGPSSRLEKINTNNKYTVGVDIFEKYIEISRKKKIHDSYVILDIKHIEKKFPPKSFDCVMLLDVIEHLKKSEGINIINKMEKIAKRKIIVSTPNGYIRQDEYHNNILQMHKSGWKLKIFKKLNFRVYGFNGLKFIRGDLGNIKLKPLQLWQHISTFTNLFVVSLPQFAFHLFCVKNLQ
ncbi:MAG: class I SAM-dependent methyltransferase [Candidatus Hodarchaeota archaeon]